MLEETPAETTVESNFLRDLKYSIEKDDQVNKRKGSNFYKPSSMNCIRSMYYTRIEAEQDEEQMPYTLIGICNSGTDTHERLQTAVSKMKDYDIDCEYIDVGKYVNRRKKLKENIEVVSKSGMETKLFHKKLKMSFLCDGIIKYKGKYYILEIKTEISNKWYTRKGVDPKHYNQATAYSLSLGIPDVIFLYVNRDNLDMKTFKFTPTDDMKMELESKIITCEDYVEKNITPERPEGVSCAYCRFVTQCRKDG